MLNPDGISKLFELALNLFKNKDTMLKIKLYKQADRETLGGVGGSFVKLIRHFSALLKIFHEVVSE